MPFINTQHSTNIPNMCRQPYCNLLAIEGSLYCENHKAILENSPCQFKSRISAPCTNPAMAGSIYCKEHEVKISTTDNESFRYSDPLLNERGKTHGNSKAQFATAQQLKAIIRATPNWPGPTTLQMHEAMEMICTKLSRIAHGDPTHIDTWDDIAGYAKLISETLRHKAKPHS